MRVAILRTPDVLLYQYNEQDFVKEHSQSVSVTSASGDIQHPLQLATRTIQRLMILLCTDMPESTLDEMADLLYTIENVLNTPEIQRHLLLGPICVKSMILFVIRGKMPANDDV
jgi:hypothetical protein